MEDAPVKVTLSRTGEESGHTEAVEAVFDGNGDISHWNGESHISVTLSDHGERTDTGRVTVETDGVQRLSFPVPEKGHSYSLSDDGFEILKVSHQGPDENFLE